LADTKENIEKENRIGREKRLEDLEAKERKKKRKQDTL